MAVTINYIISRMTVFLVLYVIWMSISKRSFVEARSSSTTRPVNLIIISDETNHVAMKSVTNSLTEMKYKNRDLIGRVMTITIEGGDLKGDLNRICEEWDTVITDYPSEVPDFVLDTTRTGFAAETVSAFTAAVGVPTLSARFDRDANKNNRRVRDADRDKYLVQVMPPTDLIPRAVRELVYQMNISNAGIIFDEGFTMDHTYNSLFANLSTRCLLVSAKESANDTRRLLMELRSLDIVNFFILGDENTVKSVLTAGQALNFTGPHFAWYALTQDDFEPRCDCKDLSLIFFKPIINSESRLRLTKLMNRGLVIKPPLTSAFYYDLVQLGVMAMKTSIAERKWPVDPPHIACKDFDGENTPIREFDYYKELVVASNKSEFKSNFAGITWAENNGRNWAQFDMRAQMVKIVLNKPNSYMDLGIWPAGPDSHFQVKNEEVVRNHTGVIRYRITTLIKPPFVMYNPETNVWSGYCIEMIDQIASMLNFTYVISEVPDKNVGMIREDGNWTGMMKELQMKRADIALGAVSIMAERESVVDFTVPYYDLVGLSILMKKHKRETTLFKFLTVLEDIVWLCILGSYFLTSLFLWIFDRWSPYSYRNNREKFKDDDEKREFGVGESLWFCMTSLTPQGGGEAPKNLSGCLVAATWWLFGFIIIASYTANLAAFLTVSRLETSVQSLDDLSKQYRIQYAPIKNTEAYEYFKRMSDIESRFYDIWRDMSLNESISNEERAKLAVWDYPVSHKFTKMFQGMTEAKFPRNMDEALARIRRLNPNITDQFALIGDATDIKYLEMTNCDLVMVGSEFSRKPYALAVQQGSPLKEPLNDAILQLLKQRKLETLKTRWWVDNPKRLECEQLEQQSDGISMANLGGIFIVTFAGTIVACIVLIIEYIWYRCRPSKRKQKSGGDASPKDEAENASPVKFTLKQSKIAFEPNQLRERF